MNQLLSRRHRRLVLVALLTAFSGFSCGKDDDRRPNVVLITLDAVRPDHLSCYGYERQTSPFIDSLAKRGCVFRNSYSASCWTPPSVASLFTSLYPRSHGVRHGFAQTRQIHGQEVLADSFLTLAEALKANGYRTFGISSTAHVSAETGMAQGFDHFVSMWFPDAPAVHESVLALKKKLKGRTPFFLWVHYFDAHDPYVARKPWIDGYARHPEYVAKWGSKFMETLRQNGNIIAEDPAIRDTLVDLYDAEINYTDEFVRRLFKEVLGTAADNALIIVTADHGEAFLEHGSLGHAQTLFAETLNVPLIVAPPNGQYTNREVQARVSLIDVYPSILDYLSIPMPNGIAGISFVDLLEGRQAAGDRPLYAEFDRGAALKCIISEGWKFTLDLNDPSIRYLSDLTADPRETKNLVPARKDIADRLEQRLRKWIESTPAFDAPRGHIHLTPDQEKTLRSLGYVK